MFHRNRFLNAVLSISLVALAGSCAGSGCGGCGTSPLPAGGLPAAQTIEGGAQVRITASGFDAIEGLLAAAVEDAFGGAICVPGQGGGNFLASWNLCQGASNKCPVGTDTDGCPVFIDLESVSTSVPTPGTLRASVVFDIAGTVRAGFSVFQVLNASCNIVINLNDAVVSADVGVGIDPQTGELDVEFQQLNEFALNAEDFSICGLDLSVIADLLDSVFAALNNDIVQVFINPILQPILDDLLDSLLPDPLGIASVVDVGAMLSSFSPSTKGDLETRIVPGGYASLEGQGLSLGVITGLNADRDPSTRGPDNSSEPALCVPPFIAPDFAAAPHNLTTKSRINGDQFFLDGAGAFRGSADATGDIILGASETTLDLAGHHLVTSGALCLNVGTAQIGQLSLGTIGILAPSFAELGSEDGGDPLLLVTRPQHAVDFDIGAGTATDPALTMHLQDFEIDFYAFIFERWVRGFTIKLSADIGVNLEFTTDAQGNPALLPMLSGLQAEDIEVTVKNSEFLRESASDLNAILPSILELALPLITGSLGEITLPSIGGFTLTNLTVGKITTTQDDFLAITADLGTTASSLAPMQALIEKYPSIGEKYAAMAIEQPERAVTHATVIDVVTPAPYAMRSALAGNARGALPHVVIDVPTVDDHGRALEYTWSINGGMWRPFVSGSPLVIEDRGLAIPGEYDIHLRARVAGDYRTLDLDEVVLPVIMDSVGPKILGDKRLEMAGRLFVPAVDMVSKYDVEVAYGRVDSDMPETEWADGYIALSVVRPLANADQLIAVFARDEVGNISKLPVAISTDSERAPSGGCSAGGKGAPFGTGLLLVLGFVTLGWVSRRRRRRKGGSRVLLLAKRLTPFAAILVAGLMPACSCGGAGAFVCEINEDCAGECPEGTLPLCLETGECLCADDIPFGRVGQYSDMTLDSSGKVWVSAYNSTHGDLMVASLIGDGRIPNEAWEFVDGVPDGPIALPQSEIRDGIFDPGDDVGLYTSITSQSDGSILVSYYDATTSSLKLASRRGDAWSVHTVEAGSPPPANPENTSFSLLGQYNSITVGPDDRPAIAYFAQVQSDGMITTQVRFAQASSATPQGAGDWTTTIVDEAVTPAELETDGLSVPYGVGVFVNSARTLTGDPVLVYHDRIAGTLKLARWSEGAFAEPEVLDGGEGENMGWYPSVAADIDGIFHVSYVDAINNDLMYVNTADLLPELVDDGLRLTGQTSDNLPIPEYQFVGDDSSIVLTPIGPVIVYQNATSHELLAGFKTDGIWDFNIVAGNEDPFAGGFGFYADAETGSGEVVMSTWVIDQPSSDAWVEIFRAVFAEQ